MQAMLMELVLCILLEEVLGLVEERVIRLFLLGIILSIVVWEIRNWLLMGLVGSLLMVRGLAIRIMAGFAEANVGVGLDESPSGGLASAFLFL